MPSKYDKVIIFGPTGDVGGAAALEASKRSATVWLAMRQIEKSIATIPIAQEHSGTFHRVQADLTEPESVKVAIRQSGARAAFVYLVFGIPSMEPTFLAMKDAGIEHVVFLSTFSIRPNEDRARIPQARIIPLVHAQAELAIEKAGLSYTTLRAGQFASNILKQGIDRSKTPWEANVVIDKTPRDNISPDDIGKVAGAMLVDPVAEMRKHVIYLLGPSLLHERQMVELVERIAGRDITVCEHTPAEMAGFLKGLGMPPPLMDYMRSVWAGEEWWTGDGTLNGLDYAEVMGNIQKYSGYEPETFEQYVAAHL
ncbi:hypothetical protein N0V93_008136 [Gnomoniopsis smithogilvyi]|uniref:NmrA-like domain-containing protein n=1 Tax=Gnomoniopsis smithogilvyi TaxID=1191159 RepID=A0A9W9CTL4_9PEZI|nr:hypothetical protein N0V93_008136 [Gnomoniopsis smithogilvyi]